MIKKIIMTAGGIIFLLALAVTVLFYQKTSVLNDLDAADFPKGEGIVNPSLLEARLYLFFSKTLMDSFYRDFVQSLDLKGGEKVLNFGSGCGAEAYYLASVLSAGKGGLTCLDLSPGWLQVAKRNLGEFKNVSYLLGDIRKLDIPKESYDAVVIHFVLHDIPEEIRDETVEAIAGTLKYCGVVHIREPAAADHGIPARELKNLMAGSGLKLGDEKDESIFIMGDMITATYKK